MQVTAILIEPTANNPIPKENSEYIKETLIIPSNNLAHNLNKALQNSTSNHILILKPYTELEDSTLEEFEEILEEFPNTDMIYPNVVFVDQENSEQVKNFAEWYNKSSELLQALQLEKYLPDTALLFKKETILQLGGFEEYGDYTIYAFLYKNLKNLTLKHSDLSFVNFYLKETFVDTSYRSRLLRDILKLYDLKELFGFLDWNKEAIAMATAKTLLGDTLKEYLDFFNAAELYRQALLAFHNQETLRKLIDTYYLMGLFDKARELLDTQGMEEREAKELHQKLQKTQILIDNIEKSVEEGKSKEILQTAQEIYDYYKGAPFYNILGVIHFIMQDFENAYRYFYKAATMNPIDNDIISNLVEMAKKLHKEQEVIALLERITK